MAAVFRRSMDYRLSRVSAITDESPGGDDFAQYTYLGAGTIVNTAHPDVTGGLNLTYGAGGTYNGLDRFGRGDVWGQIACRR